MNTHNYLKLLAHIPKNRLLDSEADRYAYSFDNSKKHGMPDLVVLAHTAQEIQKTVQICHQHHIPLTTRGRGTGTTGACVPTQGGIVLSCEQMDKIIQICPENRYAIVEPGVLNQTLQDRLFEKGFFWAPDPSSAIACTIGGNLALNASGPRAVKYGTPRENTLALTAVTGAGNLIKTGAKTTKNVVGLDLTRLLIGSEGMLGVITEATLKITPIADEKITFQVFYKDIHTASQAISAIMSQPSTPCALELIDHACLKLIQTNISVPQHAKSMLMIEADGNTHALSIAKKNIENAARNDGLIQIECAQTQEDSKKLWATRKALAPALRKIAKRRINEDIAVPVSLLPQLMSNIEALSVKYNLPIVNFGHAGNGNLHTNILLENLDEKTLKNAHLCLQDLFKNVLELEGTLSGEHGIGLEKRDFVGWQIDTPTLEIMRHIKTVFDPHGILNPEKVFPLKPIEKIDPHMP